MLLVVAGVFTAISAAWSEFQPRGLSDTFLGGQILFDLVLVTGLVHVTGGAASQFAALYILVIAVASLVLHGVRRTPRRGARLRALLRRCHPRASLVAGSRSTGCNLEYSLALR